MDRRTFIAATAAFSLVPPSLSAALEPISAPDSKPFSASSVREIAREVAGKPYKAPDIDLPKALTEISYDRYRAIRFLPDRALWRGERLPFEAQFFHRGFLFSNRVDIFEVVDGQARAIKYDPAFFSFGETTVPPRDSNLGFAGFRLHAPINKSDYYDEVCVFLGASYFRAVAKGQIYGLSARGLSINTGQPKGEEFPFFKSFWIEKPAPNSSSIVVHALLDSPSASAAYRFTIRPGSDTVFDVEMALYTRTELKFVGLAPMTSMFFFGPNDRNDIDDFRPSVHDSDGLAIQNGRGEQLWRPLSNPRDLQISAFNDVNPQRFGLSQRERNFAAYQDLESRFEKRPTLTVEPIGNWGEGAVQLIEIPTKEEVHDNIASFWTPKTPLAAKGEHIFTYRLHWGESVTPTTLATFRRTSVGAREENRKIFVLDLVGEELAKADPPAIRGIVSADKAEIRNVVTQPNPETGGWRLSFEVDIEKSEPIELRAFVAANDVPLSEVWVYRWAP